MLGEGLRLECTLTASINRLPLGCRLIPPIGFMNGPMPSWPVDRERKRSISPRGASLCGFVPLRNEARARWPNWLDRSIGTDDSDRLKTVAITDRCGNGKVVSFFLHCPQWPRWSCLSLFPYTLPAEGRTDESK